VQQVHTPITNITVKTTSARISAKNRQALASVREYIRANQLTLKFVADAVFWGCKRITSDRICNWGKLLNPRVLAEYQQELEWRSKARAAQIRGIVQHSVREMAEINHGINTDENIQIIITRIQKMCAIAGSQESIKSEVERLILAQSVESEASSAKRTGKHRGLGKRTKSRCAKTRS
jgi:hypothetical protein